MACLQNHTRMQNHTSLVHDAPTAKLDLFRFPVAAAPCGATLTALLNCGYNLHLRSQNLAPRLFRMYTTGNEPDNITSMINSKYNRFRLPSRCNLVSTTKGIDAPSGALLLLLSALLLLLLVLLLAALLPPS